MPLRRQPPVVTTLGETRHPYMTGAWTPLHEEVDLPDPELLEGRIPEDIEGVYLRNTENPVHEPLGRYHPFDGDGMIHRMVFQGGRASYANRFVRTRGFRAEQEAGGSLWGGLADPVQLAKRPGFGAHGALKDSSSTDIVVHAGTALSTFYQC
ncbi:MAG: carotenoid oxygenase family protein, partial [Phenylobacterium sp.]|nr:carotenoid oxygenase family protein [Phenylobacterium sp.]